MEQGKNCLQVCRKSADRYQLKVPNFQNCLLTVRSGIWSSTLEIIGKTEEK